MLIYEWTANALAQPSPPFARTAGFSYAPHAPTGGFLATFRAIVVSWYSGG